MTRKRRRLYMLLLAMLGLGTATALTLAAFNDTVTYFYSPSDLTTKAPGDRNVRLGGLVEVGSVARSDDGLSIRFTVTDTANSVPVSYTGIVPDLFREGQGVVALGRLRPDGVFAASEVLAKHDENYMPPEVSDALKRADHFKANAQPPASIGEKDGLHTTSTLKGQ